MDKLKSRKLWASIGGVLIVIATDWLGLSPEMASQVIDAVVVIVPSYLAGQGLVDALASYKPTKK